MEEEEESMKIKQTLNDLSAKIDELLLAVLSGVLAYK